MVLCRLCRQEKPVEAFTQRRGAFTSRCKRCHSDQMKALRIRKLLKLTHTGPAGLVSDNVISFTAGLRRKDIKNFETGFRFPLEYVQDSTRVGSLYVKRWGYQRKVVTEVLIEFEQDCLAFNLNTPQASERIPRALRELGLRISGPTEVINGNIPIPTEVERLRIKDRVPTKILKGAWECSKDGTEAVARFYKVEPKHLALIAHRSNWKRLKIDTADITAIGLSFGIFPPQA